MTTERITTPTITLASVGLNTKMIISTPISTLARTTLHSAPACLRIHDDRYGPT